MRTRELIAKLKDLRVETVKCGWFPGRVEIREAAAREYDRLGRLDALVGEIIKKLERKSGGGNG